MTMSSKPLLAAQHDWLIGGGEMGALIRSMDWSQTPLGARRSWPQSLRAAIRLCLASPLPSAIAWGPQRTHLYNDAYRRFCAASHPQSMGRDLRECWSSAWPRLSGALELARAGKSTCLEDERIFLGRAGRLEETYITLALSPLRDDSGVEIAVFIQLVELTQGTLAARRSNLLLALDAHMQAAAPEHPIAAASNILAEQERDLPFFLIYLIDSDARLGRLAGSAGLPAGMAATPALIELDRPDDLTWPLARALRSRRSEYLDSLEQRFGRLVCRPYPEPVAGALLMPLTRFGSEPPYGVLVAGVSPRLPLDDAYRAFLESLRDRLAAVLPAGGPVHEGLTAPEQRIQWRDVFENNPTMYFIVDASGTVISVNTVGAEQLGYTVEELVGQSVLQVFPEAVQAEAKRHVALCLEQPGRTVNWEIRKVRKDGSLLWVRETAKAVVRENKQLIVLIVCEDITERVEAQEKLRRSEAFLAEAQEISHTGSWGWNISSGAVVWSEEHRRIFGLDPKASVTPDFEQVLQLVHPDDRLRVRHILDAATRNSSGFDFEYRIVLAGGQVKYLQAVGKPVVKASGSIDDYIGATMDITARKLAEDALRQAHDALEKRVQERTAELNESNRHLEQEIVERKLAEAVLARRSQELARSNAELEQLAYIASHDLQEPLRMVASYLQLIARRYQDRLDADGLEFIGYAVDGAHRMQALIDDLLAYSRIGTKRKPMREVDCTAVVETVMQSLGVAIAESGARITCSRLPTVVGDEMQLTQLFQNLIANAIKFRASSPPEIDIRADSIDGFWRIAVRDNGIGIDAEYFGRIFEMFQRLHGSKAYPGTGIGLTLCRKIVECHGGRIWVESTPGKGATFTFTLSKTARYP